MGDLSQAPDVSIVITAYNIEQYVERAIMSALNQRNVNVEVIFVDDASTDQTASVVAAIDDPRVKVILRRENGGPGAARNEGFRAATAPWIALLDGDDAYDVDRLGTCLARARVANAEIVVDNLRIYREADGHSEIMYALSDFKGRESLELATFIDGNQSFLGGKSLGYLKPIFSTALLKRHQISYAEDIKIGEDYFFLLGALACGAKCAIELSARYLYTVRSTSISHRLTVSHIEKMIALDAQFHSTHKLTGTAAEAQQRRSHSLEEALQFTRLVDALKQKDVTATLKIAIMRPRILFYLWRPLKARLLRVYKWASQFGALRGTEP